MNRYDALSRRARRRLGRLVAQPDSQQLLGLGGIPVRFDERLLALHHRRIGLVAQLPDHARGDFRHSR